MRRAWPFLGVPVLMCMAAVALGGPRKQEGPELDRVAIAARLVTDGHWDRAAAVLEEVDAPPKGDEMRFHSLTGLVALNLSQYQTALDAFDAALEEGAEPLVHVYRAQAHMGLEAYRDAITALDQAGEAGQGLAGSWQLRSRAHRSLGEHDDGYDALIDGRERFPEHPGLIEDQLALLIELGLTREVLDLGAELLPQIDASATTWVAIGDRIRRAGALQEALVWLEDTRLRFPESVDAKVALASACLEADLPLCCGEMLQEASVSDNRYASEAAECFRRAGHIDRALYLNGTVVDDVVKVRQRLGLMLENQNFTQAAALHARLSRLGVLRDEEQVAYALAYAHFQNGAYTRAEELLRGLRDPNLFRQATALREAMAQERNTP
ncbi:MAG: hypothetical protein KTR31_33555 [Myxococcales bacterium]|nr:hypothetical protein [Myxococcales bacterium]